ncbi:UNVERIFIED_CONTAM: hypothetical protein Scaly_2671300 [Sesamum calycinum]|uniref:Uncharacterized protein n=1 Tax=Sesamum calycinum TaxID=2727403 RepID=A0AAW2J744_9LAMI
MDVCTSSYSYGGGGPYDYDKSGLVDHFSSVVHAADEPLWDGYNQSQLGVVELVDIKGDYYSTKKLVKDLGLPVENIYACKNGCMLYWKDDVDLEYCKFYGDDKCKPARGRDPYQKKSWYAVIRYLLLTPSLQRLYSSRATAEHMTWHATHQTDEGSMCHPSDVEVWKHFDRMYPDCAEDNIIFSWAFE